jgi:homoserine dehydrogenase
MKTRLGVGILGAGSVTQAIHLPILATLHEQFVVRHIMDIDQALATAIAARVGARASTDIEAILNDEAVDVVAICSPPEFHAEQANAACRAGKRVVFCEKPLVTTSRTRTASRVSSGKLASRSSSARCTRMIRRVLPRWTNGPAWATPHVMCDRSSVCRPTTT